MSSDFATGERQWRARLGTLRQVVRQELVARQVAAHLPDTRPLRVLDVGCGQATQLLRLALHGHFTTGWIPRSPCTPTSPLPAPTAAAT